MSRLTPDDLAALNRFIDKYPSWWWRIGVCDHSRDFTCAPQARSPEIAYALPGNIWDAGFSCDHNGTVADAIDAVMSTIAALTPQAT